MDTVLFDTCAVWSALVWQWMVQSEDWIEAKIYDIFRV